MPDYYKGEYPKSVTEYMGNYPTGHSRTTLASKYGITVAKLLAELSDYKNPISKDASNDKVVSKCFDENMTILCDISSISLKDVKFVIQCNNCSYIHTTSKSSYLLSIKGCVGCSGHIRLTKSVAVAKLNSTYKDYTFDTNSIPDNPTQSVCRNISIELAHNICGSTFYRNLQYLLDGRGNNMCANCYPSKVYNSIYEGITFNSKFELECYKLIVDTIGKENVCTHIRYRDIIHTDRKWTADFLLWNIMILEVTSYSSDSEYDKFKAHSSNLADKECAVLLDNKYLFRVARSLPELRKILQEHLAQDIV